MKKTLIASFALLACPFMFALAGEGSSGGSHAGNGGGIWTCRDFSPEHKLIWAELVDLSEARREFKLSIPQASPLGREAWIKLAEDKIEQANPAYFAEYRSRMATVRSQFTLVKDSDFEKTHDIYDRTRPSAQLCAGGSISNEPEQLANFTTQGHLIVNDSIWSDPALSEVDRAALYVHEAIYLLLREKAGATNSVQTRELVGYLFSDKPVASYADLLKLPDAAPASTGGPVLAPALGLYAANGDWANVEITYYDADHALLYLTERDNQDGHDMNSHVFKCEAGVVETVCRMTSTTNWIIRWFRGVEKHQLRFSSDSSFVWLNQRPAGGTRATRYWRR